MPGLDQVRLAELDLRVAGAGLEAQLLKTQATEIQPRLHRPHLEAEVERRSIRQLHFEGARLDVVVLEVTELDPIVPFQLDAKAAALVGFQVVGAEIERVLVEAGIEPVQ